jgi:hypothetical protein
MAQQQTNTIAHDAAVAATVSLDEILHMPPPDAELAQMIIEAAVEAALDLQRRQLLEQSEN